MMMKRKLMAGIVFLLSTASGLAQQAATKTNMLYWATTTPNLGVEVAVNQKHTAQLFLGLNPWKQSGGDQSSLRHWLVMPEYRHWFSQKFDGWFVGAHALGGQYNVRAVKLPFGMMKSLRDHRYEGWYAGGGVTGGYQVKLARHWNFEASLGLGYIYTKYDKYKCRTCGEKLNTNHKNYVGPTKVALSLVYLLSPKKEEPKPVETPVVEEILPKPQLVDTIKTIRKELRIFELKKRAYIDFPVDKIELHANYRRNPAQLDSIVNTINTVKRDSSIEIVGIEIHGYASPESPYAHNEYLAKNRAEALTAYVRRMVNLPDTLFKVAYTAEDWDGLREYIKDSNLEHKQQILDIANDESLDPDAREAKVKKLYPREYKFMVDVWYPALRHSDYRIFYKVNKVEEIEEKCIKQR